MKSVFQFILILYSITYTYLSRADDGYATGQLIITNVLFLTKESSAVKHTGRLQLCCSLTNISDEVFTVKEGDKILIGRSLTYFAEDRNLGFSYSDDIIKFNPRVLCTLAPGEVYSFCIIEDKCSYDSSFLQLDTYNMCEYQGGYTNYCLRNGVWSPKWRVVASGKSPIEER